MDKQIFKAFLFIIIFLLGYNFILSKMGLKPKSPVQESTQEQILPQEEKVEAIVTTDILDEDNELPQIEIGLFVATYSPQGGYIKKLHLTNYQEELVYKNIGYVSEDENKNFKTDLLGDRLIFTAADGQRKEFVFDGYHVKLKFGSPLSREILVFSNSMVSGMLEQRYQEVFSFQKDSMLRKGFKKVKESRLDNIKFAGARDRYFCFSLLKGDYEQIRWQKDTKTKDVYLFLTTSLGEINFYAGPQAKKDLQLFELEGVVHYGFFHGIGMIMIKLLYFLHFLTKNWGISIILFAIAIYFVLFPFTMKSTKAMKRMQDLQPEIEDLKKKYKDNPQKLNKEMMALYKTYKINPLGGCLPLFFQFPIFIALYQVLLRSIELKGASFLWIKDLSLPDRAFHLPVTIPFLGEYLNILPLCIIVISLIQQKFTTSASAPEQKKMALFFAVFIGVIFYKFPACLVLYWFVQNFLTLLYQARIAKK
jgi:YidC/Oxa1 family membrane protein insertase